VNELSNRPGFGGARLESPTGELRGLFVSAAFAFLSPSEHWFFLMCSVKDVEV
jgi:hypothetical protein